MACIELRRWTCKVFSSHRGVFWCFVYGLFSRQVSPSVFTLLLTRAAPIQHSVSIQDKNHCVGAGKEPEVSQIFFPEIWAVKRDTPMRTRVAQICSKTVSQMASCSLHNALYLITYIAPSRGGREPFLIQSASRQMYHYQLSCLKEGKRQLVSYRQILKVVYQYQYQTWKAGIVQLFPHTASVTRLHVVLHVFSVFINNVTTFD